MAAKTRKQVPGPFAWREVTPQLFVYEQVSCKQTLVGQVVKVATGWWAYHFLGTNDHELRVSEKFEAAQAWVEGKCTSGDVKP